jgi:mono/diheme cytochrome c family protein
MSMRVRAVLGTLAALGALTACGNDGNGGEAESTRSGAEAFETQADRGQRLYGEHCASCHGASGEGDTAPPVVGLEDGALPREPRPRAMRDVEFVTVADVAGFVVENMPPSDPGGLATDEYLAILAFDLKANGITLEQELDLELADTLTIPR